MNQRPDTIGADAVADFGFSDQAGESMEKASKPGKPPLGASVSDANVASAGKKTDYRIEPADLEKKTAKRSS